MIPRHSPNLKFMLLQYLSSNFISTFGCLRSLALIPGQNSTRVLTQQGLKCANVNIKIWQLSDEIEI